MRLPTGACFARVEVSTPVPIRDSILSLLSIEFSFDLAVRVLNFQTYVYVCSRERCSVSFFLEHLFDEDEYRGKNFENCFSRSFRTKNDRKKIVCVYDCVKQELLPAMKITIFSR